MLVYSNVQKANAFPRSYAEIAFLSRWVPPVIESHPRLFIRQRKWKRGPSVRELRQWAELEPLKTYLKHRPWNSRPGIEWAFRYLATGDEALVPPIIKRMKQQTKYWPGYLTTLAIEYDWLYNSPSFSDEDKRIVEDKMVAWANSAVKYGEEYHDMWSHFGYAPVTDMAAAGLALYGRRPEAQKFIAMAGGYMKKVFFPGWKLNDGAWQSGWAYYDDGPIWLVQLVALWSSATEEGLFRDPESAPWLRKHLYYLLSTVYPSGSPFESTSFSFSSYRKKVTESLMILTR